MQPPESPQPLSDPIYEPFYGLKEQPFAISTDPKFLFLSAPHRRAYDELMHGITRGESLMLLTGETGTGKTTLCRGIIAALGDRAFSAVLHQPYMTGPEMLRLILRDLGLVSREELRRGALAAADVPHLLEVIEVFLRSLAAVDARAIIVIDEAQSLSPTLLDEVRMLTALEQNGRRLVQVVLCGQPGLLTTVKTEPLYALNERITRRVSLTPLSPAEVESYIHHRLSVAGGGDAVTFQRDAMRLIVELSRGLPRRVNVLADRTLQEGRRANATTITAELVKRAARAVAGAHADTGGVREPDFSSADTLVAPILTMSAAETASPAMSPAISPAMSPGVSPAIAFSIGRERAGTGVLPIVAAIALVASLVGGGAYWYVGTQWLAAAESSPAVLRPQLPMPAVATPVAMPSDAELEAYFREMRWGTDGTSDEPSAQFPDNRD